MQRESALLVLLLLPFIAVSAGQKTSVSAPPATQAIAPGSSSGVSATVCDVASNPERYDGRLVRVSAVLAVGFEISALRDEERRCGDIWLADFDDADPSVNELAKYAQARLRNKKHPRDYAPPRYAIHATFVGRLQYTHDSGFIVDNQRRVTGIKGGFGHLGQYRTQLHLQSVADMQVRDLLGSVYKTGDYEPWKEQ